jgi:hypothetical protein
VELVAMAIKLQHAVTSIRGKIKEFWQLINYPIAINKSYDEECEAALVKFLSNVVYFFQVLFFVTASISTYLLLTREIL